jgi:hypothetical protein
LAPNNPGQVGRHETGGAVKTAETWGDGEGSSSYRLVLVQIQY